MKIAIIGATGIVGKMMMKVLQEKNIIYSELFLIASKGSSGKNIIFNNQKYKVLQCEDIIDKKIDVALFSAGSDVSKQWALKFAKLGAFVVDNSSAWRMDKFVPLVIPEINSNKLNSNNKIIANPNCSTIQMTVALSQLHKELQIKKIIVSTYQSVTGSGLKGIEQLENEEKGIYADSFYPYPIYKNCIPHCDDFTENGYTKEEMKLVNETKKIFDNNTIEITATAVRVPIIGGHCESIHVEFHKTFKLEIVKLILERTKGVVLYDNLQKNQYPMPIYSHHKDEVFVGRIRQDLNNKNAINLWICADNIRKGAATNAIQIVEELIRKNILS